MKRELHERVERDALDRQIPLRWQFLCIDLPAVPVPADLPLGEGIGLEPHEYLGLAASLPANPQRSTIMRTLAAIPGSEHDLADWLPDDREPRVSIRNDHYFAADVRAVGLLALPEVHRALTEALARLRPSGTSGASPVPLIVASSAGRTGSVLLRDVIETLHQVDPTVADLAVPIMLTPDALGLPHQSDHQETTFTTLSELLNLSWSLHGGDELDPTDPDHYPPRRRGLRRSLLPDAGSVSGSLQQPVYLIGGHRLVRGLEQPYGAVASLIATIATEQSILDRMVAENLVGRGWWAHAQTTNSLVDVVTNRGAADEVGVPMIDALGHARVSAGTHLLRRYAAETLAVAAAERLTSGSPGPMEVLIALEAPRGDDEGWLAQISERVIAAVEDVAATSGLRAASASVRHLIADTATRPEPEVRSLLELLLEPLLRALDDGTSQLASWSRDMANRTRAAEGDLTVIEPRELPAILTDLLTATFSDDASNAMQRAARDIALGARDGLRLLTIARSPRPPGGGSVRGPIAQPLVAQMHCRAEDLITRAERWLTRDSTPSAEFLAHGLRTIVSVPDGAMPGGSSTRQREDRLVSLVREALSQAAPRVALDEHLAMLLHPEDVTGPGMHRITWFGNLPFKHHPLESRLLETLNEHLYDTISGHARDPGFILTAGPDEPHVDIVTGLRRRVELSVVSSLMHPIAHAWSQVKGDRPSAQRFLIDGRSRPLAESLPLPTAHLRAMIRGWFTGRVLGLLEASLGTQREDPWVPFAIVLDPLDEPRRATFVDGGPPQAADTGLDLLAHALRSIAFAQLEVSRTGSPSPLSAYRALRDLGMSDPSAHEVLRYPKLAPVIAEWIETGVVLGGGVLPDAALHPKLAAAEDPEARREALAGLFESAISDVTDLRREHVADEGPRPRHWREAPAWLSLDDHILASLRALVRATRGHPVGDLT